MTKMWIVLATWLCCNIAISSCLNAPINYPSVKFTTHLASVGSYQSFMSSLRKELDSGSESHDIPLLRKPTEITNNNKYLLVNLINYDSQLSITLAVTVVNVYVIGYKSAGNSFFLKDAPSDAKTLLFQGTNKITLSSVDSNYNNLGDRSKVGLGIGPLSRSIDTLNKFNGVSVNNVFKESLLVVIQMVAEAARFKFIQLKIENNLLDEYKPKNDTISYENNWEKLSEQIQLSGTDGKFKKPVTLLYANGTDKIVSTVAQVKPDISILLYKGSSGITAAEEKVGEIFAKDVMEEWLPIML
uniref:rRNA N-glycosylase n=1 Tax=Euphorbia serrata TaxID=196589 RepID=Q8GZN9_9ROSI|nr:ribosome inactivating protein Euserratin 2 precursor [Euphorbia serrata]